MRLLHLIRLGRPPWTTTNIPKAHSCDDRPPGQRLIPWSLGLVSGTDALLARVLFWFTGHPMVYFWLLPASISWDTLAPRQAGGRLFSDPVSSGFRVR